MGRENLLFRESELQGKMKGLLFFQEIKASVFGGFLDAVIIAAGGLQSAVVVPAEPAGGDPEAEIGQLFRIIAEGAAKALGGITITAEAGFHFLIRIIFHHGPGTLRRNTGEIIAGISQGKMTSHWT